MNKKFEKILNSQPSNHDVEKDAKDLLSKQQNQKTSEEDIKRKYRKDIMSLRKEINACDEDAEKEKLNNKLQKLIRKRDKEIESLNESALGTYKNVQLTSHDEKLIFGNLLENIFDIVSLENELNESKTSEMNAANGHASSLAKAAAEVKMKQLKTKNPQMMRIANDLDAEAKRQKFVASKISNDNGNFNATHSEKDAITGETIKEDNSYIETQKGIVQRQIDRKNEELQKLRNKQKDLIDKDRYAKQLEKNNENSLLKSTNESADLKKKDLKPSEVIATTSDGSEDLKAGAVEELTEMERISPDLRYEKKVSQDLTSPYSGLRSDSPYNLYGKSIDKEAREKKAAAEFETMLFNGQSGDLLKYFIKNEINNNNKESIEIAKIMQTDPEVAIIVKKIRFYITKANRTNLSYEDYIDLKVQKSQFRILFTKAKNKYNERFEKKNKR